MPAAAIQKAAGVYLTVRKEASQKEALGVQEKKQIYQAVAEAQLNAWKKGSGYFYWSYKLLTDTVNEKGWIGWDSWDLGRCVDFGWFPTEEKDNRE